MKWFSLNRKALPGILAGLEQLPLLSKGRDSNVGNIQNEGDLLVGIPMDGHESNREMAWVLPEKKIFVICNNDVSDLFSWINTYSPDFFPLSQFGRVISVDDWHLNSAVDNNRNIFSAKISPWASVVVGEMLGQGGAENNMASLPLSRATACFSYSIARASRIYGADSSAAGIAVARLRLLQKDSRFNRRSIGVDDLSSIWSVLRAGEITEYSPNEAVRLVIDAMESMRASENLGAGGTFYEKFIEIEEGLSSDSAEKRVRAFDRLSDRIFSDSAARGGDLAPVLLAGAAFLVGRGTTHIALIKPFSQAMPSCLVWFSLFAGLCGPRYWHSEWARAVRGVERQLAQRFEITEPSSADLCWIEYFWLSNTFESIKVYGDFHKLFPRVLSVELIPGVTCQFRLDMADSVEHVVPATIKENIYVSYRNNENNSQISELIERINDLAKFAGDISCNSVALLSRQSSFFQEAVPISKPSRPRAKKSKKISQE